MTKNRIAKFNIEQIGIDEDVLFNLMTHDEKYDYYALRPDEVRELQNSIQAVIDDRDRLKQANAAQLEACIAAFWMFEDAEEKIIAVIDAASETFSA